MELEQLVAAGLTPAQAIHAGTGGAARILGAEKNLGTIEEGKWADLVLLDANPLEDIRNTRKIWRVMQYGRWVDREAILKGHKSSLQAQTKPDKDYLVYVLSEAADKISLVRFGPEGARIDQEIDTGEMPIDLDGPHGIAVSPDRQFYYVSIAHGRPFGSVWKYSTKDNSLIGKTSLGHFPATLDVTPDGNFLFVVNFNLHGDMVPSSVSVSIDTNNDGSRADKYLHDAARFAYEFAGNKAVFGVHDGRHAGRDRHAFVEGQRGISSLRRTKSEGQTGPPSDSVEAFDA